MGKDIGTLTFDTFNDLRKVSGSQSSTVTVLGKDTINDLDGGRFYWDSTSTDADDNQNILQKTGLNPGRWVRFVAYTENFGNTNLTLTSDRNLNGNGYGLVFSNLSDLNLYANNIGFTSQVSNTFTFSGTVGLFTFDTSLLSGASKNIQIPNTTGVIALQSYVTSSTASVLSSANTYTDAQIANSRDKIFTTDGSGLLSDSYLVNKDVLALARGTSIYIKDEHFTKNLADAFVTMISPNGLLPTTKYLIIL